MNLGVGGNIIRNHGDVGEKRINVSFLKNNRLISVCESRVEGYTDNP